MVVLFSRFNNAGECHYGGGAELEVATTATINARLHATRALDERCNTPAGWCVLVSLMRFDSVGLHFVRSRDFVTLELLFNSMENEVA